MSSDLNARILDLLLNGGSLKAVEIAARLGVARADVNAALYGSLRGKVTKLPGHRWVIAGDAEAPKTQEPVQPNRYAGLFRYYLDCLASDAGVGVSVFAESRYDLDYALLPSMPLGGSSETEWTAAEGVDRLLAGSGAKGRRRRYGLVGLSLGDTRAAAPAGPAPLSSRCCYGRSK